MTKPVKGLTHTNWKRERENEKGDVFLVWFSFSKWSCLLWKSDTESSYPTLEESFFHGNVAALCQPNIFLSLFFPLSPLSPSLWFQQLYFSGSLFSVSLSLLFIPSVPLSISPFLLSSLSDLIIGQGCPERVVLITAELHCDGTSTEYRRSLFLTLTLSPRQRHH